MYEAHKLVAAVALRPVFFCAGRQGIRRTIGRVGQHRSSPVIQASLAHLLAIYSRLRNQYVQEIFLTFSKSALYTNRYVDEKSTDEKPIRRLIELQRRLLQSKSPFARRIGTLLAAGALNNHLAELDDHQIGQLLLDEVGGDLGILQPEATICHQATQRLFRSENGSLEEDESPKPEPLSCPNCGNEMLFHYGIDEPDFYQCVYLNCRHKLSVTLPEGELD